MAELSKTTTLILSEEELKIERKVIKLLPYESKRRSRYIIGLTVLGQVLEAKKQGKKSIDLSEIDLK